MLKPLAGLQTPNEERAFIKRWNDDKTLTKILSEQHSEEDYLIPVELEGIKLSDSGSHSRLIAALLNIGVAEKRPDGRLNIPDLFQVASGMLRKGGVPPVQ